MDQPQAGDIWQFDTKDWDGYQHFLYLEYQGMEDDEQKWLAIHLDTGKVVPVYWWVSSVFKKVA